MKTVLLAAGLTAWTLAAQTGVIEGTVLNAKTGAPLKRANVHLNGLMNRQAQQAQQGPQQQPPRLSKETDDQGHFTFTGLPAGRYSMTADRQGYLRQSYGSRSLNTNGTPFALAADGSMKGVVFKLSPQAVIAGRVLDEDGDPVANLQVHAYRMEYRGATKQWSQVSNGQTSDIGEYRLPNLQPGQYLVATGEANNQMMNQTYGADALPDKPEMMYAATYYPNGLDSTAGSPVAVTAGAEVHGIDIRLRKVQVFRVRGKVVNPAGGQTVAPVMLSRKDGTGNVRGMGQARTQDGRFEIRGVTPGSYIASARMGGANQQLLAAVPLEVGNNHVEGLVLTLSAGVDITGSVRLAEKDAQVAFTNLNVFVRPVGFFMGGSGRGKVGDDLKFVVHNVAGMRFTANASGLPDNCFVQSIKYGGQDVTEAGVDLVAGAPLEIVISATAGSITGAVTDKDGKPVVSAIVAFMPKDGTDRKTINSTDENGTFTIKGLKPGDYRLYAWEDIEDGAYNDPEFLKKWSSRATDVTIDPSSQKSVQYKVISAEETAGK
ncbi:MAG TPA: carboxypeptidase-like regulatory domain-containing protein [Candidatus Sulfopaludibacter sp.]|jgi:protocatechuate 3,4-dioxygenase beta subunit|nr:carboxypeptidase-like regulatory domain-containing protein [Candidatus Sulfopaludibacter sp.]